VSTAPDVPLSADALDRLWDFDDPAGSERRLRVAASEAGSAVTAAELTTQVARALGLQGRFDEADALLDSTPGTTLTHPAVSVRVDLERGRLRNSAGDTGPAAVLFRRALDTARAAGLEFLSADAAHMLAIAEPDRAEQWTAQGLAIAEASADPRCRRWAGSLHNNLGWTRQDAGDPAGALREFEAALSAYRLYGTAEQVGFAQQAIDQCRAAMREAE
jgi:tetratricopeptide (TPR) repeat protein